MLYFLARSYFIAAPRKIHPDMVVQILVAITKMYYKQINVRAAIKNGEEEIAAASKLFEQEGHTIMQLYVSYYYLVLCDNYSTIQGFNKTSIE